MSKSKRLAVPPDLLYLPLVGNYYRPTSAQVLMRKSKDDDLVFLKRDPNNPKDSNAVKVYVADGKVGTLTLLGFVQRHAAARLTYHLSKNPEFAVDDFVLALVKTCPDTEFEMTPFGIIDKTGVMRAVAHHADNRMPFASIVQKVRTQEIGDK